MKRLETGTYGTSRGCRMDGVGAKAKGRNDSLSVSYVEGTRASCDQKVVGPMSEMGSNIHRGVAASVAFATRPISGHIVTC
jgi:hypothetical protein